MSDEIKNRLEKTDAKIKGVVGVKSIKDGDTYKKDFTANGTNYKILPIDEVFTVERMTAYQNINLMFSLASTPVEIHKAIQRYKDIIIRMCSVETKVKATDELIRHTYNLLDSFQNNTNRFPQGLYICTLFIIRENENISKWSFDLADEKINDWAAEGLNMVDFLGLAIAHSVECQKILNLS